MEDQNKLVRLHSGTGEPAQHLNCSMPTLNALLTAYCFGCASAQDIRLIETHLPDCPRCRYDVGQLTVAIQVLETDSSLLNFLHPAETASAFGVSGKLLETFGGYRSHIWFVSVMYALLGGLGMVMEFSYEFTQYVWPGLLLAILAGVWLFTTTYVSLWGDWKLTTKDNVYGFWVAMLLVTVSFALLFTAAYLILPARSITKLTDTALTAQIAFQKDIIYHLIFLFFFGLPPLHCVWRLQFELAIGNHQNVFSLLMRDSRSVSPRGLLFPRFGLLFVLALAFFFYSIYAHFNLMGKLQPVSSYVLFATLVQFRLVFIYLFIARCLYWYAAQLNEIKRECLIYERLDSAGIGKDEA